MSTPREVVVEQALCTAVAEAGGIAYKFVSPGLRGVPDRLVLLPKGIVLFAEVKRPGGVLAPWQAREIERMRRLGVDVRVIDSVDAAKALAANQWEAP